MKNKILIELYIVELDQTYNICIPYNEYVGKVIQEIVKSAFELADATNSKEEYYLINPENGIIYSNSSLIIETDIRNSKKVFLI